METNDESLRDIYCEYSATVEGKEGTFVGWVEGEYAKGTWISDDLSWEYSGTFKNLKAEGYGIWFIADTITIQGGFVDGYF